MMTLDLFAVVKPSVAAVRRGIAALRRAADVHDINGRIATAAKLRRAADDAEVALPVSCSRAPVVSSSKACGWGQ